MVPHFITVSWYLIPFVSWTSSIHFMVVSCYWMDHSDLSFHEVIYITKYCAVIQKIMDLFQEIIMNYIDGIMEVSMMFSSYSSSSFYSNFHWLHFCFKNVRHSLIRDVSRTKPLFTSWQNISTISLVRYNGTLESQHNLMRSLSSLVTFWFCFHSHTTHCHQQWEWSHQCSFQTCFYLKHHLQHYL